MSPTADSNPTKSPQDVPGNFYRGARFTWHQRRRHALVRRLMSGIERKRILDYGCGYGDLTYALSKNNSVVGIDIDADRVAFARSQYPELQFHQFDGISAPFADGSFDVVMSSVVLPFIAHHASHFNDLARLVSPNGRMCVISKNTFVVRESIRKILGRPPIVRQLNDIRLNEALQLASSNGFERLTQCYFYDPPFDGWKTLPAMTVGIIEQTLSLARIQSAANYWGFIAVRRSAKR